MTKRKFSLLLAFLALSVGMSFGQCSAFFQYTTQQNVVTAFDSSQAQTAITNWAWDFGDGTNGVGQVVTHPYNNPGAYLLCLTITAQGGCTSTYCDSVLVGGGGATCNANFNYTANGNTVTFTDGSTSNGTITGWNWSFGDGTSGTGQTVTHTYNVQSPATVCLTITTSNGCTDTQCMTVTYGGGGASCQAQYSSSVNGNTVAFSDLSTSSPGNIVGWAWDYGDGNNGTQQNPTHTYSNNGVYLVCLDIFTTDSCTSTYCDSVVIGGGGGQCQALFTSTVQGQVVTMVSNSTPANQINSYAWNFGNGASGTGQVVTALYNNPGSYLVCLTITTVGGCTSTYCDSVVIGGQPGPYTISGTIFPGNQPNTFFTDAEVFLIVFDSVQQTLTAIDTVQVDSGGMYLFTNVASGDYRVKAALLPANASYTSYLPTYYLSDLFWSNATSLQVNSNQNGVDIGLIPGNNPGGPGFVGGLVTQGANKTAGPGDPLENIQIMVLDMSDNPIQYVTTNANGEFNFSNLAYGTYKIYAEVLGKQTVPEIVTLNAQNPRIEGLSIEVNSDMVVTSFFRPATPKGLSMEVYPNPVRDRMQIAFESDTRMDLSMSLLGLDGRVLQNFNTTVIEGKQSIDLEVSELPAGIYFLQVQTGEDRMVRKIMKH